MADKILGVIGGSGLYHMKDLKILEKVSVATPFGDPSADLVIGELQGARIAFLPRHGVGHAIPPSEINFRANIFAMKKIGVERIVSVSAVGSMKESVEPGHFLIPDQFIDRTHRRISTFFTQGLVGHVGLADPICSDLAADLAGAARTTGTQVHEGATDPPCDPSILRALQPFTDVFLTPMSPKRQRCSRMMQLSMTTAMPAARAFSAASSLTTPSCIHTPLTPI